MEVGEWEPKVVTAGNCQYKIEVSRKKVKKNYLNETGEKIEKEEVVQNINLRKKSEEQRVEEGRPYALCWI